MNDDNVTVMDTPTWSVRQALLSALEEAEKEGWNAVAIVGRTREDENGGWSYPNTVGGEKVKNETLFYMGHVLQRRVHDQEK